eukprot:10362488-Lingulodinium_polyedra.AAC.1
MRSNRTCAAAAVRELHDSRAPCEYESWCSHGVREACDLRATVAAYGRLDRSMLHGFQNRAQ